MDDTIERITRAAGLTAEEAERLREATTDLAERTTLTMAEAAEKIMEFLRAVFNDAESAFQQLTEEIKWLDIEPRARRKKRNRTRSRFIEQRYRAEIRRAESERIYRRIYKPP